MVASHPGRRSPGDVTRTHERSGSFRPSSEASVRRRPPLEPRKASKIAIEGDPDAAALDRQRREPRVGDERTACARFKAGSPEPPCRLEIVDILKRRHVVHVDTRHQAPARRADRQGDRFASDWRALVEQGLLDQTRKREPSSDAFCLARLMRSSGRRTVVRSAICERLPVCQLSRARASALERTWAASALRYALVPPAALDNRLRGASRPDQSLRASRAPYSGMLSCFFQGFSSFLLRSMLSTRDRRRRVECGMITSSM